jgi:cholesterol oxidase
MANEFDAIIVGSGFGGAVTACRLAERGFERILVLERGREWNTSNYPWKSGHWCYDPDRPEDESGWLDLRIFKDMAVAQGAGVGGGSLIYANISVEAKPELFNQGWPPEITYQALAPYYAAVGKMLEVAELPDNQLTERFKLMQEAAQKIGAAHRFRKLPLAVKFSDKWNYDLEERFDEKHSVPWVNDHGVAQGTCVHRGYCDIGCPVQAKNTLDLNYLARAKRLGVAIRPLHLVRVIEPVAGGGYEVRFDAIEPDHAHSRTPGSATADRVILAAGSLGSTELLLRCRDQHRTLPGLSPFLGMNWSSNGDFLTPAFHPDREPPISPSHGPTITSAIDFLDGSEGAPFFIEDGGVPDLLKAYIEARLEGRGGGLLARTLLRDLREGALEHNALSRMMPWFAQGIDAADGRLYLGRKWWAPWRRRLKLDWDVDRSAPTIEAIIAMHRRLSEATGGRPWVPPTWTLLKNLVTPHPLGGCNMGITAANGVVDHQGRVFGYDGLYVADGAIIPEAVGLNPSRTIAALAERIAALMP